MMREYKSKRSLVVELVREAIRKGEIAPGQQLRQEELARELGVSPTPVREALRLLEAEGIVVHIPNRGVKVAEISFEDVQELYLIRRILESEMTAMAVPKLSPADLKKLEKLQEQMEEFLAAGKLRQFRKANEEVHLTLYRAANSPRLQQLIANLWMQCPWDIILVVPGRAQTALETHRAILDAIKSGDARRAGELIGQDVVGAAQAVMEHPRQGSNDLGSVTSRRGRPRSRAGSETRS